MPDTITMQVSRYRPDNDREPTIQEYTIPLRQEWAVLDGLNYIKDRLDAAAINIRKPKPPKKKDKKA